MFTAPKSFANADFPTDAEGRTFHVQAKKGEVANRIVTVGSLSRAAQFSKLLDRCIHVPSTRGFSVYTGLYKGVPISIIGTGMGIPMIDMMIREVRHIVDGDIAIVRFGTCGGISQDAVAGSIVVATDGAVEIRRNPDHWTVPEDEKDKEPAYIISRPVHGSPELEAVLIDNLVSTFGNERVLTGLDVTADSYFSSQGRPSPHFNDENEHIIERILHTFPTAKTLEMETFHMFDLARVATSKIYAAGAAFVVAQRNAKLMLDMAQAKHVEEQAATPVINTLASFKLEHQMDVAEFTLAEGDGSQS